MYPDPASSCHALLPATTSVAATAKPAALQPLSPASAPLATSTSNPAPSVPALTDTRPGRPATGVETSRSVYRPIPTSSIWAASAVGAPIVVVGATSAGTRTRTVGATLSMVTRSLASPVVGDR